MSEYTDIEVYNPGILGVTKPWDCCCQDLLKLSNLTFHGWLRKQSLRNKLQKKLLINFLSWPQVYVVLADKSLYWFDSETSRKASGSVSLYGFNRVVRAGSIKVKEAPWAFRLEHIQPEIKSLFFSAPSEKDMVHWMQKIKHEMLIANNKIQRNSDGSHPSFDQFSQASSESWGSSEYGTLEAAIYIESSCNSDQHFDLNSSDKDEETSSADSYDSPFDMQSVSQKLDSCSKDQSQQKPQITDGMNAYGYSLQSMSEEETKTKDAEDLESYWEKVHFDGDRIQANDLISSISDNGVYLIRKSEDGASVLVVFAVGRTTKYKIVQTADETYTLSSKNGPYFGSIEELLFHYYDSPLPNVQQTLTTPFQLHPLYTR